jgi:hypothetical protein
MFARSNADGSARILQCEEPLPALLSFLLADLCQPSRAQPSSAFGVKRKPRALISFSCFGGFSEAGLDSRIQVSPRGLFERLRCHEGSLTLMRLYRIVW